MKPWARDIQRIKRQRQELEAKWDAYMMDWVRRDTNPQFRRNPDYITATHKIWLIMHPKAYEAFKVGPPPEDHGKRRTI